MAVQTDKIDFLSRPFFDEAIEPERRPGPPPWADGGRRWVFLSLFNGIDGFLIGFEKAAEARPPPYFAYIAVHSCRFRTVRGLL